MARSTSRLGATARAVTQSVSNGVARALEKVAGEAALDVNGRIAALNMGEPADPADRLPAAAAARLRHFREQADEGRTLSRAASDELREQYERKQSATIQLREYTERSIGKSAQSLLPEDHPTVIELRARMADIDAKISKINAKASRHSARFSYFGRLAEVSEAWVKHTAGGATIIEAETPKLAKSDTVDGLRAKLKELGEELEKVERAPVRSDAAKAKARALVEELAASAAPDVSGLLRGGTTVKWPMRKDDIWAPAFLPVIEGKMGDMAGKGESRTPDTLALLAALATDQMVDWIETLIDAEADDEAALTDEARAAREQELAEQILATERKECALVADSRGEHQHRLDSDPRALLGVTVEA